LRNPWVAAILDVASHQQRRRRPGAPHLMHEFRQHLRHGGHCNRPLFDQVRPRLSSTAARPTAIGPTLRRARRAPCRCQREKPPAVAIRAGGVQDRHLADQWAVRRSFAKGSPRRCMAVLDPSSIRRILPSERTTNAAKRHSLVSPFAFRPVNRYRIRSTSAVGRDDSRKAATTFADVTA